jgi:hypothetical protein
MHSTSNFWLSVLLSGTIAAAVSALITIGLSEHYSRRRFRVENFERLRQELQGDERLRATKEKVSRSWEAALVTEDELRDYLEFIELVGVYWKRNLVDRPLLNEILADYILDVYEYPHTKTFIISERQKWENDRYYENFVAVAKWCERREGKEKAWTRRKRGVPVGSG